MQGKGNALMLLPPTVAAGETLDVQVLHTAVRQLWMNEVFKEMNVNGYIKLVRGRRTDKQETLSVVERPPAALGRVRMEDRHPQHQILRQTVGAGCPE